VATRQAATIHLSICRSLVHVFLCSHVTTRHAYGTGRPNLSHSTSGSESWRGPQSVCVLARALLICQEDLFLQLLKSVWTRDILPDFTSMKMCGMTVLLEVSLAGLWAGAIRKGADLGSLCQREHRFEHRRIHARHLYTCHQGILDERHWVNRILDGEGAVCLIAPSTAKR
jgi:hypothetical protein